MGEDIKSGPDDNNEENVPDNNEIAPGKTKSDFIKNRRAVFITAAVSIILLTAILWTDGVFSDAYNCIYKANIDKYASNNQLLNIIDFIAKHHNIKGDEELVYYAISKMAETKDSQGCTYLESMFYDKNIDKSLKLSIIQSLNINKLNFNSTDKVCKYYLSDKRELSQDMMAELGEMIRRYDETEVKRCFLYDIKLSYDSGKYKEASSLIDRVAKIGLSSMSDIKRLSVQINVVSEDRKRAEEIQNDIKSIEMRLDEAADYVNNNRYFNLRAYMVAELDEFEYEIAMPERSHSGEIPSDKNHAILVTTSASFASKGWLNIDVKYQGKREVRLKKQYGGFTQLWSVYAEVSPVEKSMIQETRKKMRMMEAEISYKQKQLGQINDELDKTAKDIADIFNAYDISSSSVKSGNSTGNPAKDTAKAPVLPGNIEDIIEDIRGKYSQINASIGSCQKLSIKNYIIYEKDIEIKKAVIDFGDEIIACYYWDEKLIFSSTVNQSMNNGRPYETISYFYNDRLIRLLARDTPNNSSKDISTVNLLYSQYEKEILNAAKSAMDAFDKHYSGRLL